MHFNSINYILSRHETSYDLINYRYAFLFSRGYIGTYKKSEAFTHSILIFILDIYLFFHLNLKSISCVLLELR